MHKHMIDIKTQLSSKEGLIMFPLLVVEVTFTAVLEAKELSVAWTVVLKDE